MKRFALPHRLLGKVAARDVVDQHDRRQRLVARIALGTQAHLEHARSARLVAPDALQDPQHVVALELLEGDEPLGVLPWEHERAILVLAHA